MPTMRIACSTITWNSEHPQRHVDRLAEIARAGYEGAPCGPHGDETADEVRSRYASHGLACAPGYLSGDFWLPEAKEDLLHRAASLADFTADVGCTELFVAASGFGTVTASGRTRRQAAGHVLSEEMLSDSEFAQFAETLSQVGSVTLERGVRTCFHNHVGSFIETREEIDRLFALVDHDVVFQGPDIGHLAWAGADPVAFCRDYAETIKSVHLKDIYPDVMAQGVAEEWDYGQFSEAGIFAELGEGMVDFTALFDILRGVGYAGWLVVEIDRTVKPTAYDSAVICREYLRSQGF